MKYSNGFNSRKFNLLTQDRNVKRISGYCCSYGTELTYNFGTLGSYPNANSNNPQSTLNIGLLAPNRKFSMNINVFLSVFSYCGNSSSQAKQDLEATFTTSNPQWSFLNQFGTNKMYINNGNPIWLPGWYENHQFTISGITPSREGKFQIFIYGKYWTYDDPDYLTIDNCTKTLTLNGLVSLKNSKKFPILSM